MDRRGFLKLAGSSALAAGLPPLARARAESTGRDAAKPPGPAHHTLRLPARPVRIAPGRRFSPPHLVAGADLGGGKCGGRGGPVYMGPRREAGAYDREVFLTLKEFEPSFARGGDMPQDFLSPATIVPALKAAAERNERAAG